ncbi:MAG: hypothetical protein H6767_02250 [Candidatus Peribacteria bacterium]|nr:MAG: hypothetical protein H6767_02250 [Candidatus Peribacteria bacterium]
MMEKIPQIYQNIDKTQPIEEGISPAVNNITRQTAIEIEGNIRRENQGLPPEYVENDPLGLTPERMDDGLQRMRKSGEIKAEQERAISWVKNNAKIEQLPKDVICIHATMDRNIGVEGHVANMATHDQPWDKRMLQSLNPSNLQRIPHAEFSTSLVKLGDFKDSQIWSQVGLIVCGGEIKESSTCDANSKYISETQQRVGKSMWGGGYQRTRLKSGKPITFTDDKYEIVTEETLEALRNGDEIQDTDPLLLQRNINDTVRACLRGNHATMETIVRDPKFSAAFYTIPTGKNLGRSFYANTSFQKFKEFTDKYGIPMVFNRGGRFYAPKIEISSNKILTFRNGDGEMISYLEKPFPKDPDTFFYSNKDHTHRKLPVLPENPVGTLVKTRETDIQMISLGEDITDKIKDLPSYTPSDRVRNIANAEEISNIHHQEHKTKRLERERKEDIRKNIQEIARYTDIINTSQYSDESDFIWNIARIIEQGNYDLEDLYQNGDNRRVLEILEAKLLSLKQAILDHETSIRTICEQENESFSEFISLEKNISDNESLPMAA